MTSTWVATLAAALAVGLAGCGGESPQPRPPADVVTPERPASDSLGFELVVPAEVRVGEPVPITLRLTNASDRPLELHLLGRTIAFDISVARESGPEVWRRLEGAVIPGILRVEVLAPGQTLELRDVWRQRTGAGEPVGPGTYTVQGILPTEAPEPLRTGVARVRIIAPQ